MRDYSELMNMAPAELIGHALDCALLGHSYTALIEALAHQLETEAEAADKVERLAQDLADAEQRATMWQEECRALQRQLDVVR